MRRQGRAGGERSGSTPVRKALRTLSRAYAAAARAPSTRALYRYDFKAFVDWCKAQRFIPMPATPETVALYLAFRAETGGMHSPSAAL
jgi:hypothetical protein